ncbi:MAG TPA: XdhC family protein [Desulfotomaculum sp.]|nr:MAG: hypothetical protein JL56_14425 [Desulfotomaculum sp. BICA1-6]HBX24202.1 XdhC family protein [Desulfotomaculum sp.]
MNAGIVKAIVDALQEGKPAVLVTLCETRGSTPRKAGAKMLVYSNGAALGTIGGGQLEYQAVQEALKVMNSGESVLWERDLADEGMVCGGSGVIFIECISS